MKKENEAIKGRIIIYIRDLFEHEEEDYYKSVRVGKIWSNNYIEYESNCDRNKILSVKEYFNKIRPYLKDVINYLKKSDIWKIQLLIRINFMSSEDNIEKRVMYSKGENIEIRINNTADEIIVELIQSLLSRYQIGLKTLMKRSDFIFDCIYLLYYRCHKINFKHSRSYIDSPDWIKKVAINPISKKAMNCFRYAITVAWNHKEIGKYPEIITKIKAFIKKYEKKRKKYPFEKDHCKKSEKNNLTIALNVLLGEKKNISCLCFKT